MKVDKRVPAGPLVVVTDERAVKLPGTFIRNDGRWPVRVRFNAGDEIIVQPREELGLHSYTGPVELAPVSHAVHVAITVDVEVKP